MRVSAACRSYFVRLYGGGGTTPDYFCQILNLNNRSDRKVKLRRVVRAILWRNARYRLDKYVEVVNGGERDHCDLGLLSIPFLPWHDCRTGLV